MNDLQIQVDEDLQDSEVVQSVLGGKLTIDETTVKTRKSNKPDVVRHSFLTYLREKFPYKEHWEHPTDGTVYPHDLIKSKLSVYREYNRGYYRALWCCWTTQRSRDFIAGHFNFSGSSIKRRWNKSIDTLILMLVFPDLEPLDAINLYSDRM